jgi:hypothetical protein
LNGITEIPFSIKPVIFGGIYRSHSTGFAGHFERDYAVIDGSRLIELLKKYQLGVVSKFVVDETLIESLESKEEYELENPETILSKKLVTENDIRAKIIRIPSDIKSKLPSSQTKISLAIEDAVEEFNIDQSRTYIGGVSELFRKYQLLDDSGNYTPKQAVWKYQNGNFSLGFEDANEENRSAEIFKAAMDTNFPAAKRIKNTTIYEIDGKKNLIRYSKVYNDGIHYWFGILESDLLKFSNGEIDFLYLLCVGNGFLIFDKNFIFKIKDKLNVSVKEPTSQFHIHIEYFNDEKILLILKNGERMSLEKTVRKIPFK